MQIPLFDEDEYYKIAIAVAKESSGQEEFEQKLDKINRQQRKKLTAIMDHALKDALANAETFTSNDAWLTAIYASQTGCLQYFVQLLEGVVSGRKAAVVGADAEHEAPLDNDIHENLDAKARNPAEEQTRDVVLEARAHADYSGYPYMNGPMPRYWDAQHPDDYELDYRTRSEGSTREQTPSDEIILTGPCVEYTSFTSDGTTYGASEAVSQSPPTQQLPRPISSDKRLLTKDNGDAVREVQISTLGDDGSAALTKKRVRPDEDAVVQEPKRRKLEHNAAPTPPRQNPRKRSRSDDDGEDNGYKRQKIESLPSPPTSHTSSAESGEDTAADGVPSTSPGNALANNQLRNQSKSLGTPGAGTAHGKRKYRKGGPVLRTTRAKASRAASQTPRTYRSSRRSTSSSLWELDASVSEGMVVILAGPGAAAQLKENNDAFLLSSCSLGPVVSSLGSVQGSEQHGRGGEHFSAFIMSDFDLFLGKHGVGRV
ncbi:hypothetical protein A9Z42_0057090 [Trichoderma parareesei]|uniref:Uncharacterized protein n=1 Tax=Trichoderma parareesei TaxID=858221 RepID=A0A2H2ZST7_TRIPA|nr:hypothetical protein A9Z42_0057090 [Trichoderma parareesei]